MFVEMSKDGNYIASCCGDATKAIIVHKKQNSSFVKVQEIPNADATCPTISISEDGRFLIKGSIGSSTGNLYKLQCLSTQFWDSP